MTYDLRREPWIPWRRRSGAVEWGPPPALVSRMTGDDADPVVALAAPRPDFDGAMQEFLVGLLSAALQPEDEDAWLEGWRSPPTVEELQAALDELPDAFDLDGDGPRFFQDLSENDCRQGKRWTIESLLIDTPGSTVSDAQKREVTTELFVKAGCVLRLSRPAAAMALVAMQSYAPEGGRGHLTSMRGGGPLTTLVDPRGRRVGMSGSEMDALWFKLWANAETLEQLERRMVSSSPAEIDAAFPWLTPTRASDPPGRLTTTPAQAHPLQTYFGLPRRIRLEFELGGTCDITGRPDSATVVAFWMKGYGVDYPSHAWKHPLSPYYQAKPNTWLPEHGRPSGIVWRDWVGLTVDVPTANSRPAQVVAEFNRRARMTGLKSHAVHAFGLATKKNKAIAWTDAMLPAFVVDGAERHTLLYDTARALTEATSLAGTALLGAVKTALFQSPDDAPGDLGHVKLDLWAATERAFYAAIETVADPALDADAASDRATKARGDFVAPLTDAALAVFDRWCPTGSLAPDALRRRVAARHDLLSALRGFSKLGESICQALGIAPPGGGRAARATRRSRPPKEKTT